MTGFLASGRTSEVDLSPRLRSRAGQDWRDRFPPRIVPAQWAATRWSRAMVVARLTSPPFANGIVSNQRRRRLALTRFLDWLEQHDGRTWQQRWLATGIAEDPAVDWRPAVVAWLRRRGETTADRSLTESITSGLGQLIYADVLRPDLAWIVGSPHRFPLGAVLPRVRDPEGFAALTTRATAKGVDFEQRQRAVEEISILLAAKGGAIADITVGDCLELMELRDRRGFGNKGLGFYQLLHGLGHFPPDAPSTLRMLERRYREQLTDTELVDQYQLHCQPVRDLLVAYLAERRPHLDYASVNQLAYLLVKLFWKDLEIHHPGIDSLRLPPAIAAAWKSRLTTKTLTRRAEDRQLIATVEPRIDTASCLSTVRGFYLDIAHWASEEPERWAAWAAPCPISRASIRPNTSRARENRKSRMDQRTRDRIPVLPVFLRHLADARAQATALLETARNTTPGNVFTCGEITLRRAVMRTKTTRIWVEDPDTGARRDLTREDDIAFWCWAAVEVLRTTGIRIEELTELSHHSLIQYRLPSTDELIPLLHIMPSKTDTERLLVIAPELADVLATIIHRIRDHTGTVPMVVRYDIHERTFTAPTPLLFQHRVCADTRPIAAATLRLWITAALNDIGLRDASGNPLHFQPHDFRRIFATEAIRNGMPPHICQLIMGHTSINTTMGYKAVYPDEAINGHHAFLARRREQRPSTEYRAPTDDEWDEFLGHFQQRKLSLGTCGRAYGTDCIHEHTCIRCPLLRPDPAQLPRLTEIRDNLLDRITEAQQQGWRGEIDGLKVSLSAANNKIAQLHQATRRRTELGMPSFHEAATNSIDPDNHLPPSS